MNNNEVVKNETSNLLSIGNNNIQDNLKRKKVKNNLDKIAILKKKRNSNKENKDINELRQKKINIIEFKDDNNVNKIKPLILNDIKYGIDENGNPMKLDEYFKNLNNKKKGNINQWPIAYIITDKNNNNKLVDLKGNEIIKKNKDGNYEFPFQFKILINDFDVKYPELRINAERKYSIESIHKIKNNNINHEKKNSIDNNCNKIIEEISLQIDSCDTNESSFGKINNNLNYIFKNNLWSKKEKKEFSKIKNKKKHYKRNSINNFNYSFKNCNNKRKIKFNSFNKINITNSQEFIERTNSILNGNKTIEDIYHKNDLDNNNITINQKNIKKNNILNSKKNYLKEIFIPFSPNKYKNKINSYTNNSIMNNISSHRHYMSNTNTENNYIKICKNPKKKYKNNFKDNFNINSFNNKDYTISTIITSPSTNNKNKIKKIFKGYNFNSQSYIFNSNNNIGSNNNKIKNHLINNDSNTQFIKKQNEKKVKLIKDENVIVNKFLSKDNIFNIYYKKANTIDNKDKNINKKKYKINYSSKICKLTINNPKKLNRNYSILTEEANNMIKKFILNKNILINQKNILKRRIQQE